LATVLGGAFAVDFTADLAAAFAAGFAADLAFFGATFRVATAGMAFFTGAALAVFFAAGFLAERGT
jgi:hypothetical protein